MLQAGAASTANAGVGGDISLLPGLGGSGGTQGNIILPDTGGTFKIADIIYQDPDSELCTERGGSIAIRAASNQCSNVTGLDDPSYDPYIQVQPKGGGILIQAGSSNLMYDTYTLSYGGDISLFPGRGNVWNTDRGALENHGAILLPKVGGLITIDKRTVGWEITGGTLSLVAASGFDDDWVDGVPVRNIGLLGHNSPGGDMFIGAGDIWYEGADGDFNHAGNVRTKGGDNYANLTDGIVKAGGVLLQAGDSLYSPIGLGGDVSLWPGRGINPGNPRSDFVMGNDSSAGSIYLPPYGTAFVTDTLTALDRDLVPFNTPGGSLSFFAGVSKGTGADKGGHLFLRGGDADTSGSGGGGSISLLGGTAGGHGGAKGGHIVLQAGAGGDISLVPGAGGQVHLIGTQGTRRLQGTSPNSADDNSSSTSEGSGGADDGDVGSGGSLTLTSRAGSAGNPAGDIMLRAGSGRNTTGGSVFLRAGHSNATTTGGADVQSGGVVIQAGDAYEAMSNASSQPVHGSSSGSVSILGGSGRGEHGRAGGILLQAGRAVSVAGAGGDISLLPGLSSVAHSNTFDRSGGGSGRIVLPAGGVEIACGADDTASLIDSSSRTVFSPLRSGGSITLAGGTAAAASSTIARRATVLRDAFESSDAAEEGYPGGSILIRGGGGRGLLGSNSAGGGTGSSSGSSDGGSVSLLGGWQDGSHGSGGHVVLQGGSNNGTGPSGSISLVAGQSTLMSSSSAAAAAGRAGAIHLRGELHVGPTTAIAMGSGDNSASSVPSQAHQHDLFSVDASGINSMLFSVRAVVPSSDGNGTGLVALTLDGTDSAAKSVLYLIAEAVAAKTVTLVLPTDPALPPTAGYPVHVACASTSAVGGSMDCHVRYPSLGGSTGDEPIASGRMRLFIAFSSVIFPA